MLSNEQRKRFEVIESILIKFKNGTANVQEDAKTLARYSNTSKSIFAFPEMYSQQEMKYAQNLNQQTMAILNPIYEKIIDMAFKHFVAWYDTIDGGNVIFTTSQMKMAYWMLDRIVKKEIFEDVLTINAPRGLTITGSL